MLQLRLLIFIICGAFVAEISVRSYYLVTQRREDTWKVSSAWRPFTNQPLPAESDDLLGWIPSRGQHFDCDREKVTCTIGTDSFRLNAASSPDLAPPDNSEILAVGDSFTFGQGVNDDESWPAHLEKLIGRRVVNGGVFGYGVDQSYLRMEEYLQSHHPKVVLFSLIPEDIDRAGFRRAFSANKPFFTVTANTLQLHAPPKVPQEIQSRVPAIIRPFIASSAALTVIARRFLWPGDVWISMLNPPSVRAPNDPNGVFCTLVNRLAILKESAIEPILVIQSGMELERSERRLAPVRNCIQTSGTLTLDILERLKAERKLTPTEFLSLFNGHMTNRGNRWVAERIAERLHSLEPSLPKSVGAAKTKIQWLGSSVGRARES